MSRVPLPVVLVGLLAAPARAEPAPVFELSVTRAEGAEACPSGNEFERRVSARLGRVPFTSHAEQAIEATLSHEGDVWRAEISLRDARGVLLGERRLDAAGEDCEPLAEATTLALALTIDPDASAVPAPHAPAVSPVPPPALCPPPTAIATPPPPPVPSTPAAQERVPVRVAASLRAALAAGVLPRPAGGVALNAEAGSELVRVELGLLYLPEVSTSDQRFAFGLTAASLGGCGFPLSEGLELGVCAALELGGLHAVVRSLEPLEPGDQLWLAFAAGPRLRLAGPAGSFVEVGGSALVPLLDRTFDVRGVAEPAFETAPVGGLGFFGVGLRAP